MPRRQKKQKIMMDMKANLKITGLFVVFLVLLFAIDSATWLYENPEIESEMYTVPALSAAAVDDFLPVADGFYHEWKDSNSHYIKVDETPCNGNSDKIYAKKAMLGARDSFVIDLAFIPDNTIITSITIKPCAGKYGRPKGYGIMDVFYRYNGIDSSDIGNYILSSGTPTEQIPMVFDGLSLEKTSLSTLEVGVVNAGGTRGVKLSRIAAEITYEFPPEPPVVTLTNPPDDDIKLVNSSGTTSVIFTADIDAGVADLTSIELIKVSGIWPTDNYIYSCPSSNCQEISQGNWQATFAINNMGIGSYAWNIKATNDAGQNSQASFNRNLRVAELPTGPNVILILTDDQRWDEVHEIPGTNITTMPNVESRLLDKGIEFTNSFVTTSLCCPNRATILTGQYAFHHGVLSNKVPYGALAFNDTVTLGTILHDAGYKTALIGKYLNKYDLMVPYVPPGWDRWSVMIRNNYYNYTLINENSESIYYADGPSNYSTDVFTQQALEFINQASAEDRPFFLELSYYSPHIKGRYSIPAPRHEGSLAGIPPYRPPNFNEADVSDKIIWTQNLSLLTQGQINEIDQRRIKGYESLLAVDEGIASLMNTLQNLGIDENTIVIFTSDNGYSDGEHRRFKGKKCIYEECLRVPFIVRAPMFISSPTQNEQTVLSMDILPTILELANITIPGNVDGKSFVPLLQGSTTPLRSDFLFENWDFNPKIYIAYFPTDVGIRTPTMSYAEFPETGEKELYNLTADPYQLESLHNDPAYAGLIQYFSNRILEIRDNGTYI